MFLLIIANMKPSLDLYRNEIKLICSTKDNLIIFFRLELRTNYIQLFYLKLV